MAEIPKDDEKPTYWNARDRIVSYWRRFQRTMRGLPLNANATPVMRTAWATTPRWLTRTTSRSGAFGLMYCLKRSYERILLTAIIEEETVLVRAMKIIIKNPTSPLVPITVLMV